MASADVEGPVQAGSFFLTNPTRRRSGTGMPASTTAEHDHSSSNANHHSAHSCCNNSRDHGHSHSHCSTHAASHGHAHSQASPTAAIAPQLHTAGLIQGPPAAGAAAGQQGLMRSSSLVLVTTRIHAAAICCPMESRLIHNILDSVPGVLSVNVMVVTKMVAVHHDPAAISPAALVAALNSAGLQASLNKHSTSGGTNAAAAAAGGSACSTGCCGTGLPTRSAWQQTVQQRGPLRLLAALRGNPSVPPLCVLVSALLLVVNLLMLLPGVNVPAILQKGLLALLAAAVAVPPVLKKAWHGLKARNLDMNSLVVVALFGAIGLGDWFEAGALVVLFTLAEWLEERCVQRAAGAMEDILKLQPEEALVVMHDSGSEPKPQHSSCCDQQHDHQQPHQHEHAHNSCGETAAAAAGEHAHGSCCHQPSGNVRQEAQLAVEHVHVHDHGHEHAPCGTHGHHEHAHGCSSGSCSSAAQRQVAAGSCSAKGSGCNGCHHHHQHVHSAACHHDAKCSHSHEESAPAAGVDSGPGSDQHSCDSHDSACCSHADGSGACTHKHRHHNHQQQHQHKEAHSHAVGACHKQPGQAAQQQDHVHHEHGAGNCCDHSHSCSHDHHQQQQVQQPAAGLVQEPHAHNHDAAGCCAHDHQHSQGHTRQHSLPLKSVPVSQLPVSVLVLVRPGDKVPVDGTIQHGTSVLDESMITGESKPVTKIPGDSVLAGTINCGSVALRVRATAAASDSTVARLGTLMEAAAASKSKHDMRVELFARYYTPAIVLTALLVAAVGSAVQPAEWRHWTYLSLVVLVTGCPCALVISTPVASVAGLTRAAKKGVLIKGGRPLELLGNLTAASFDKSGTLTEGHFQLTKVHTFSAFSRQQALQLAAMLEQHSNHPIAHAIVGAAAASGCMSSGGAVGALQVTEVPGKGLQGNLGEQAVAVGSWNFAQELLAHKGATANTEATALQEGQAGAASRQQQAAVLADAKQLLGSADTAGSTVVCLVVEQQLAALLLLSDRARSDAMAAVQQLQQLGVKCLMMTGDTMGAAAHVAGQLGIRLDDVCAELLPQEKLELLSTLRQRLATGRARGRQQGIMRRCSAWARAKLQGGEASYCSCGEAAGECSCRVALGPDSSSMHRSPSGGLKGSSSSGMRIDSSVRIAHADGSSSSTSKTHGVIIAHVGDGINDAPALAGADVGVAMGVAGAALAVDAADVALFSNNLTSLPFVVRLGRRAAWVVAVNTVFACSIKLAVLGAAAGGVASLWLSLLADVGSSLLVTLHALTLLRFEAGLDEHEAASKLYGSRLSGIPLVGEGFDQQVNAAQDAAGGSSSSAQAGAVGSVFSMQWVRQLLTRLPGGSWLRPYDKLGDRTPAVSAGVSRLNSSNVRGGFLVPGSSGPSLTPKGLAAQELQEMAILACATTDATGLLGPRGGSEDRSWSGARVGAGIGYPVEKGAQFVIDDECC